MSQRADRPMPPAVVLAAGDSSRFWPLSTHAHKSMAVVAGRPLLEYCLLSLKESGVTEVILVSSPKPRLGDFDYQLLPNYFGDGSQLGLKITYVMQDDPAGLGHANAIELSKQHLSGDFLVVQPENLNAGLIVRELLELQDRPGRTVIAGDAKLPTGSFGGMVVEAGRLTDFYEKKPAPAGVTAVRNMGVYLFGESFLAKLTAHQPHRYQHIYALVDLAKEEGVLVDVTRQPFLPLKYPWDLLTDAVFLLGGRTEVAPGADVASSATLVPPVYIGPNAVVGADCRVGPLVCLEAGAQVAAGTKLDHVLIGRNSHLEATELSYSVVGEQTRIGRQLQVQAKRSSVKVLVKGDLVDTGFSNFGTVIGHHTNIGDDVSVRAGAMVGSQSNLPDGAEVTKNVSDKGTA